MESLIVFLSFCGIGITLYYVYRFVKYIEYRIDNNPQRRFLKKYHRFGGKPYQSDHDFLVQGKEAQEELKKEKKANEVARFRAEEEIEKEDEMRKRWQ